MVFYTNFLEAALGMKVMMISYRFLKNDFGLTTRDKEFIYALLGVATYNYLVERDVYNTGVDMIKKILQNKDNKPEDSLSLCLNQPRHNKFVLSKCSEPNNNKFVLSNCSKEPSDTNTSFGKPVSSKYVSEDAERPYD